MLNEKLEADLLDLVSALESACSRFKQRITQKHDISDQEALAVSEANFNLNYTEVSSPKLGTFEIAEEKTNLIEKWTRANNILKQNNATISTRYHGNNYNFSYWLYNGKIYRQELKRQNLHG